MPSVRLYAKAQKRPYALWREDGSKYYLTPSPDRQQDQNEPTPGVNPDDRGDQAYYNLAVKPSDTNSLVY